LVPEDHDDVSFTISHYIHYRRLFRGNYVILVTMFTDYKLKITISGFDQTMIESKNTTLANSPAHMTVKEQESSIIDIGMGSEQKIMEVWTIYDDKWYNIMFVAPADRYETYFLVVHSMIDSFRIIS
jgi:hypothetical protein